MKVYYVLEDIFQLVVNYGVLFLELIGVAIILATAFKCVIELFRRDERLRLDLAEGIALALEFKLGGEILRTTLVRDWNELGIVGAIIALRGLMTFLIHWEIKNEQVRIGKLPEAAKRSNGGA